MTTDLHNVVLTNFSCNSKQMKFTQDYYDNIGDGDEHSKNNTFVQ